MPGYYTYSTVYAGPSYITISGNSTYSAVNKKPLDLEFSMSTEVILGWRAWRITDYERRGGITEKRLQALGTSPVWEPYQPNVAICAQVGSHEAPWPTCRCGFWAFKDRKDVESALFHNYHGESGKVIGQVALWGRVLEGVHGYRGEYAYPQTLQFIDVEEDKAKEVANLYGVPYSIVPRSQYLTCVGYMVEMEYDFDRTYVTIRYQCGLEVRSEISRLFEGKGNFDMDNIPPCPHHS